MKSSGLVLLKTRNRQETESTSRSFYGHGGEKKSSKLSRKNLANTVVQEVSLTAGGLGVQIQGLFGVGELVSPN